LACSTGWGSSLKLGTAKWRRGKEIEFLKLCEGGGLGTFRRESVRTCPSFAQVARISPKIRGNNLGGHARLASLGFLATARRGPTTRFPGARVRLCYAENHPAWADSRAEALRYRVVKAFIGVLTPSLVPLESIDSTV
jgi:hypothetical protein